MEAPHPTTLLRHSLTTHHWYDQELFKFHQTVMGRDPRDELDPRKEFLHGTSVAPSSEITLPIADSRSDMSVPTMTRARRQQYGTRSQLIGQSYQQLNAQGEIAIAGSTIERGTESSLYTRSSDMDDFHVESVVTTDSLTSFPDVTSIPGMGRPVMTGEVEEDGLDSVHQISYVDGSASPHTLREAVRFHISPDSPIMSVGKLKRNSLLRFNQT